MIFHFFQSKHFHFCIHVNNYTIINNIQNSLNGIFDTIIRNLYSSSINLPSSVMELSGKPVDGEMWDYFSPMLGWIIFDLINAWGNVNTVVVSGIVKCHLQQVLGAWNSHDTSAVAMEIHHRHSLIFTYHIKLNSSLSYYLESDPVH